MSLSGELKYLAIFSAVLILPHILLKLKIPSGISALLLGISFVIIDPAIKTDQLFVFLSQLGITSLFVFSGLEVDFKEFAEHKNYFLKYLTKTVLLLAIITVALYDFLNLDPQASFLLALGIFTPSAGFIINSLHSYKIGTDMEYWVKSKAISKEVIAIIFMFFAMQSGDLKKMVISTCFFIILFLILPKVFKIFFKYISPLTPNLEVPFLVSLSLIAGVLSKAMGAYYLVGAFAVGLIGASFKKDIFKEDEEVVFKSLSSFFTVFLPFYFFMAGTKLSFSGFDKEAITLGLLFVLIFVPIRMMATNTSLRIMLSHVKTHPYSISLSLMPTLIFGLVIAGVLKERSLAQEYIVYGLIFYTLITSLLPTVVFATQKVMKIEDKIEDKIEEASEHV